MIKKLKLKRLNYNKYIQWWLSEMEHKLFKVKKN